MKSGRRMLWVVCAACLLLWAGAALPAGAESTEFVVLTTTDMHGKCWEENLLTKAPVTQNMLRVSTAAEEFRQDYGQENVLLIDNGDLFQGTPVSEMHLRETEKPEGEAEAMALCLREIGYDALNLGNHEFNYPWETMSGIYAWLRDSGVAVLGANVYYDGSDGVHAAGENALDTYLIREVTVGGNVHRIGLLGLENSDISRWDLPAHYPGLVFTHPDHPDYDLGAEAFRYIAEMKAEGCEMILVTYHGGLGSAGGPLAFGVNTDNQGLRILRGTDSLDLLILGHDHSAAYSNTYETDGAGREVLLVNGGSQSMTKTVFLLKEDPEGKLVCQVVSSENLDLSRYEPDRELETMIRPYADLANRKLDEPIGYLSGAWDASANFCKEQTDTMDLVNAALMSVGTRRMEEKYGAAGLEALKEATGLDHLEVDAAISTDVTDGYVAEGGPVSIRELYRLYRFSNSFLVIPMYGRDLKAVMEENAATRLRARVLNGKVHYLIANDYFTHLIFGGINFTYDLSRPEGDRVAIRDFANGRPYDPDALYLVGVNNYILGNEFCGLRSFSAEEALWSQGEDEAGGAIQSILGEYITLESESHGSVTPETFTWNWSFAWSGSPEDGKHPGETAAATWAETPQDGRRYVLYHEAQGCVMTEERAGNGFAPAGVRADGNDLVEKLPEDALIFTVHREDEDTVLLTDQKGRYLTCGAQGGLRLTREASKDNLSLWRLVPLEGGWGVLSMGAENLQALEYYSGVIATYRMDSTDAHLFNFYELTE